MNIKRREILADFALLLIAMVWGLCFSFLKICLEAGLSSIQVMCIKFCLGATAVTAICFKQFKKIGPLELRCGLLSGILLFAANYTGTAGLHLTSASNSAIITATYIVMIPFIWCLLGKARLDWRIILCAIGCFAGIALINYDPSTGLHFVLGDLVILLSALLFALQIVYVGYAVERINAKTLALLQVLVCAGLSLIICLIWDPLRLDGVNYENCLFPMLYVGILGTGIGYGGQVLAQQFTSPSKAGIILALEGFWGAAFAIALGLTLLTPFVAAGTVIGMASIVMVEVLSMKKSEGESHEVANSAGCGNNGRGSGNSQSSK